MPNDSLRRRLRTGHLALALTFVAFGAVDGTWAARLPALKHRLALDSGHLGLVIFGVSATATLVLPLAGWLAARLGSRAPAGLGLLVLAAGLAGAGFAPSFGALVGTACTIGAGLGVVDVGANAHGVALERRVGRPILSALHGTWSVGLLAGSAIAAGAAALAIGPRAQFPAVAAGVVALGLLVVPRLLSPRQEHGLDAAAVEAARFALPRGALALPAALAFGFLARGVGLTWALGLVAVASALIALLGPRLDR